MANKISTLLSNTKTRTFVLIVAAILIVGVVVVIAQSGPEENRSVSERVSKTTEVPNQIQSTPGEKVTRKYQELQQQANIKGSEEAAKEGKTFIPTLTGAAEGYSDADFEKQLSTAFDDLGGKCSKEKVAQLRAEGKDTTQIILELKSYGCSAAAIAGLFSPDEIAAALLAAADCGPGASGGCKPEDAAKLKQQGYGADQIAAAFKNNGCEPKDAAAALKSIGVNSSDIAKALKGSGASSSDIAASLMANGASPEEIAKAMKDAGGSSMEIAKALRDAGASADQVAMALKSVGADASDIANALAAAGYDRADILPALSKAGFSSIEIAKAMSSLNLDGANNAALIAQQQARDAEARRLAAQQEAQQLASYSQQRQGKIQELVAAMEAQKKEIMSAWSDVPQQVLVQGKWAESNREDSKNSLSGGSRASNAANGADSDKKIILKAGSILFAVLDTAVNSDEPGPVMATIVAGSLKGSKLMGSMTSNLEAEKISLKFTAINMPNEPKSMGISAVAIDPDTARTALASDVDHHYLLRWGSLFASAFMEGYASAVASSGSTQTVSQGAAGTVTTTTAPPMDGREQLFSGLAAIGTKWSEVVGKNFDKPITVTIDQGTSIGILITSDLAYGSDPTFYNLNQTSTTAAAGAGANGAAGAAPGNGMNLTPQQASALISALQTQNAPGSTGIALPSTNTTSTPAATTVTTTNITTNTTGSNK